jgi:hypothetical protein
MERKCLVEGMPATFHVWSTKAYPIGASLCVGGYPAGQVINPVAIVEYEDGTVEAVLVDKIQFVVNNIV